MKFLWKRSTKKREREYSITKRVECVTTPLSRDFAKRWSIVRVKVRGEGGGREGEEDDRSTIPHCKYLPESILRCNKDML